MSTNHPQFHELGGGRDSGRGIFCSPVCCLAVLIYLTQDEETAEERVGDEETMAAEMAAEAEEDAVMAAVEDLAAFEAEEAGHRAAAAAGCLAGTVTWASCLASSPCSAHPV